MLPFPLELEVLVAVEQMEQPEIHRAHVERRDFRLEFGGRFDAFFRAHEWTAARGEIDDRIRLLLDARQKPRKRFGSLIGTSRHGIARVKMQDGGPSLRSRERLG